MPKAGLIVFGSLLVLICQDFGKIFQNRVLQRAA